MPAGAFCKRVFTRSYGDPIAMPTAFRSKSAAAGETRFSRGVSFSRRGTRTPLCRMLIAAETAAVKAKSFPARFARVAKSRIGSRG